MCSGRDDLVFVRTHSQIDPLDFSRARSGYSPISHERGQSIKPLNDVIDLDGVAAERAQVFNTVLSAALKQETDPTLQSELERLAKEFERLNR